VLAFSRVADRREYPAVIPINLVKRQMPSILQRSDYVDFLLRMKFDDGDPLSACSREAYADFKRTLRGIGKSDVFPRAAEARQRANEALNLMIRSIRDKNPVAQKILTNGIERHMNALQKYTANVVMYHFASVMLRNG